MSDANPEVKEMAIGKVEANLCGSEHAEECSQRAFLLVRSMVSGKLI